MVAERQILATEGSQRGGSIVTALLSYRWGARTYGAATFDEFGLFRIGEDEAQAWADRYFVADNAVLFMTGEPSDGFRLELPRGERSPAGGRFDPRSSAPHGDQPWARRRRRGHGGRTFSRHRACARFAGVRRHARLRHELGVSYHVGADYQLAGPDRAHLTIAADCLDTNAERVANTLLTVIDNLASRGPEEADMKYERERFRRAIERPRTRSSGSPPAT